MDHIYIFGQIFIWCQVWAASQVFLMFHVLILGQIVLFLVYPARYCWGRNKGFKAKTLILIQFELCEKFGLWCVDFPLHYSQTFSLSKYLL